MDLNHLTPEQIASLKTQLSATDSTGRSPIRPRQLHNLTLAPTATDPRPLFVWSAEGNRDQPVGAGTPYPKLLWHGESAQEITVYDPHEETERLREGFITTPPSARVIDAVADLSAQLAGLSDEEQALILEAQKQTRIQALTAKLSQLSEADLERLLGHAAEPAKKRGRPAKAVA